MKETTKKATDLLDKMPIGNARAYCQNTIDANFKNRAFQIFYINVKRELNNAKILRNESKN